MSALEHWPSEGLPPNPGAWIATTARRKAIDRLRRTKRLTQKTEALALLMASTSNDGDPADLTGLERPPIEDDRLRLIFTCCHPALAVDAQVALTLRLLGGLRTPEIARAFLLPEPTLAQRLVRAKRKIRSAAIPYRVPAAEDLPERLGAVPYHLWHSTRAELLTRLGRGAEAADAFRRALDLATNEVDRRHLSRRLDQITGAG